MLERDILALLRLLEDTDPIMAAQVADALVEIGEAALPALQAFADHRPHLAAKVTQRIEAQLLEREWRALARSPNAEAAALLLARWLDPLLEPARLVAQLDALAEPLEGVIPTTSQLIAYRKDALVLREWLAGAKHFRGSYQDHYSPSSSLLPHVLESRRGNAVTLSMIYLFVARRLGAPLHAIVVPRHVLVRYGDLEDGIYIDPFNQGAFMTQEDCRRLLSSQGQAWRDNYLQPATDHALIERMLRHLVNAYAQHGNQNAVNQTIKYFEIWTDPHAGSQPEGG